MKIIGRTLVILAAALVVVGITFAVARSGYLTSAARQGPPSGFSQGQAGASQGTGARGGPGRGERGSGGLFALFEVGKNLGIIAVIVAIVAPMSYVLSRRKQRTSTQRQASPPDPQVST